MTKNNISIAFCGIDGSGKSTHLNKTTDFFANKNLDILNARLSYFPLNDYGDSKIKDYLLNLRSLYEIINYYTKINFQSRKKDLTLYDRHILCYLAYAYAHGINPVVLLKHCFSLYPFIKEPDLTIYFNIDVNIALERIENRTKEKNKDKSESYETLSKAKEGYERLIPHYKNVEIINVTRYTNRNEQEIFDQVRNIISYKLSR